MLRLPATRVSACPQSALPSDRVRPPRPPRARRWHPRPAGGAGDGACLRTALAGVASLALLLGAGCGGGTFGVSGEQGSDGEGGGGSKPAAMVPPAQGGESPSPDPVAPPAPQPSSPPYSPPSQQPTSPSSPPPADMDPPPPAGPTGEPLPAPEVLVSEAEFPVGVRTILERRCGLCHTYGERDPAGWGSALDLSRMIASDIIVPGDPDGSRLYQRVAVRADMPYNGDRLSSAEVQTLRAWIANLARPTARPKTYEEILDLVADDQDAQSDLGDDVRYLSFAHFAAERRSPEELAAAEAVLVVVLNSLSKRATPVKPQAIDPERTIFRIELSDLGWSRGDWDALVSFDPYCVRSDDGRHRTLYGRLRTEAPYVRADWFIATATRPPLYHRLLDIPATLGELEDDLGLDISEAINHPDQARPDIIRIGFRSSGVSANNRMIERHELPLGGYFWISYDFAESVGRSDIRDNPLGPTALDERGFNRTFDHAGGEIIYTLPNGFLAYMLVDAAGNRLDVAPKNIVRDPRRRDGAVENGVSCIGCHGVTGMNQPRAFDEIVRYAEDNRDRFSSRELTEIRNLYPENGSEILTADAARYLEVKAAVGGGRAPGGVVEYDAFINLVGQYEAEVGLQGAAIELGLDLASTRNLVLRDDQDLLPLGLADPLVTRNEFVCRYRDLIVRTPSFDRFCAGTFTAPEIQEICQ